MYVYICLYGFIIYPTLGELRSSQRVRTIGHPYMYVYVYVYVYVYIYLCLYLFIHLSDIGRVEELAAGEDNRPPLYVCICICICICIHLFMFIFIYSFIRHGES